MIIGLSGKKKSGKDFAYQIINSEMMSRTNTATRRYAFADEVKRVAAEYFGYKEKDKDDLRFVLQGVGQMMREEVDKNYWVKQTIEKIHRDTEEFTNRGVELISVITDVRYRNEADMITALDGQLIRIERPINPDTDNHPSEVDLDDYEFKHVIVNDKDKADYIRKVKTCLKGLL